MRYGVTLSLLALVACGGTDSSTTTGGTNDQVAILTIKSSGITTQTGGAPNFSVPNPGVVQFTNSDTVAHSIASTSAGCSALTTGTLAAGQSSGQLVLTNGGTTNIVCTFSDATNTSLTGTVTILTSNTGGSGY